MNRAPMLPPAPRARFLRVDLAVDTIDAPMVDVLFAEAPAQGLLPGPRVVPTIDANGQEATDLAGITRVRLWESADPAHALTRAVLALSSATLLTGQARRFAIRRAVALALAALALEP